MCQKTNYKNTSNTRIDKCLRKEIKEFNQAIKLLSPYLIRPLKIVASCCGHGKYPKTIILREKNEEVVEPCWGNEKNPKTSLTEKNQGADYSYFEHFSKIEIPRNRNFYKKDSEGFYYIPEINHVSKEKIR